ncbi:DUF58 domain-containing protein [Halobacteriales archaeon QS_8_69_26]|nr:MAG: DUF58 domain-containing protein [Halobacteriales archaeon QS_8_69_26]
MSDGPDRIRTAVGVGLFAVGAVALLLPDPAPFPELVALAGVLALVVGVRAARRVDRAGPVPTPDVEALPRVPVPGATFDRTLAPFLEEGQDHLLYPRRVRAALSNAAVAVLARYRGLTPATARDRVEAGEWTDDPVAAAFLAPDAAVPAPEEGWIRRNPLARRGRAFGRGVRHAVAAVAAVAGADVGPPSSLDGEESDEGDDRRPVRVGSAAETTGRSDGETAADGGDGDGSGGETTDWEPVPREGDRRTGRWAGLGAATFALAGVGAVAGWPGVLLAGAVTLGVAGTAAALATPAPGLSVDRELSATDPDPGDRVSVTVTVTNEGDRTVPDLRVVDGVPGALPVVDGSPRWAGPLRPGRSVTIEYAVAARRGRHEFDPLLAVARDPLGTGERIRRVPADTPPVTCLPHLVPAGSVPVHPGGRYAGEIPTNEGGEGVEFHATREYRRGDPLNRVDWSRLARHGELVSREFRRERATTAVVVVDARPAAYLAPGPGRPHAVDRSVAAARGVFAALDGAGNRVGLAAVGDPECWLAPGSGADHRARARELLATHPALSSVPPRERGPVPTAPPSDPAGDPTNRRDPSADRDATPDRNSSAERDSTTGPESSPDRDPTPDGGSPADPNPRANSTPSGDRDPVGGPDPFAGPMAADGTGGTAAPSGEGSADADGVEPPGAVVASRSADERRHLRRLRTRLPDGAHVVFCSPVADPGAVRIARGLSARGHPVTVLAPDPTAADGPTRALARVGRVLRLAELRDGGPAVVDWPADGSLAVALARARR